MAIIGTIFGGLAAYLVMALLGLLSLVAPNLSDRILENLKTWSETE